MCGFLLTLNCKFQKNYLDSLDLIEHREDDIGF